MSAVLTSTTSKISTAKYGLPQEVRFCVRCVISNQRPSSCNEFENTAQTRKSTIAFDEEGVCDACRVAERKAATDWAERERQLRFLLDQYRSKHGMFDVLVSGSGGKDSFLAAHVLKHKYNMHPLLCTWAPAIYTEWGWRNLVRWQSIAPHILVTPNREIHRLLARLSIENMFHPFAPFIYGQKGMAPKLAAQHGIRLVMYGESEAEYGNPKAEADTPSRAKAYFTASRVHLGGVSIDELRDRYKCQEYELEPYMPAYPELLDRKRIDVRYLGYYMKWKPQEAYYYAVEHGGFEVAPERTPSTYSKYNSIDDKLDDLHYRSTYIKFGIGRATYDAAQETRSGDITREESVALVHRFDSEWPGRFEQELWDYLSVPDFPSMNRVRWLDLEEQFKSPHLWNGDKLRCVVS